MTIRYGTSNAETISPVGKAWTTGYGTGAFSASNNSSPDIVYAGSGNDTIYYLTSLADNDLFGEDGNDTLTGGVGHDLLDGGNGDDKLTGGIGSDDLLGGAGIDTLLGGDGNDNLNGGADNDTLTGGNGIDRFIIDNTSTDIVKDLGVGQDSLFVGAGSTANVTVTAAWTATSQTQNRGVANLKTTVDVDLSLAKDSLLTTGFNVTATGAAGVILKGSAKGDTLNGGAGIDTLYGNAGDDNINGGAQGDTLVGGLGNDTYVVDNIFDVVSENAGEGTDLIQAGVSYALSADVENLTLIGTGMINGTGNGGNNAIIGNTGNNILNGGAGVDSLAGGAGNDTYVVDNAGDQVNELAGQGTDLVQSSIDFSLASKASTPDVENLTLTGSAVSGTGNAQNNIIRGNTANNTLDGAAGADTMKGGNGDDSYYVDNSGDIITELSAQGSDTVFSSITYALSANVENLILTGSANINGTGNSLSNYLWGNSGDNSLNGGTGADTMIGDGGDDTYYVDNVGDVVTEAPGQGNDSVYSSISYTLTADVESLTLTGASAINGAGNKGNNAITGNTGNNILDGGANADTLTGGLGNDTYVVDNAGDVVVELLAEGTDLVKSSSVNIDLTSLGAVENITLTGVANLNATGNAGINTILGNNGDNVITGGASTEEGRAVTVNSYRANKWQ